MNIAEIEARIRAAVDARKAEGFRIIYGSFGSVESKCLCPLACFRPGGLDAEARRFLGVSQDWVSGFLAGFDGLGNSERHRSRVDRSAIELGAKLRAEYIDE